MADNILGNLIWIEHYGKAKYKDADAVPRTFNKTGKYSSKNSYNKNKPNTKTYKATITKTVDGQTKNTSCVKTYTIYTLWENKKLSGNKQRYKTWNGAKYANGFLSTLGDNYEEDVRYQNLYVCDSATGASSIKANNGGKRFPTPSALDFSFQDIDVEVDDETNKKTVTDVGRGQSGYLTRNRVRDNVVKIEVEWWHLTASEASNLLKILSYSASPWLRVQFRNPYSNVVETKWFYAGDRTITKSYNNVYTNLKVSLVEK